MTLEIREVAPDEFDALRAATMVTFGEDGEDIDPDGPNRARRLLAPGNAWAAFDGATIVGTAGTLRHTVVVPGGATLEMAGLTMVTVRPTHRRRGIARALLDAHLAEARRRAVPVSGLWASEASIYGRFGYGLASESHAVTIADARALELTHELGPADALEWIGDVAQARELLPPIFARAIAHRPGAVLRTDTWWDARRFLEAPFARAGMSRLRHVLARRGGEPVGYLQYRQRPGFDDGGLPNGTLAIVELIGVDARAEATLWEYALRVDLFPTVTWWNAPVDDLLPWLVGDPRRVGRRRTDALMLRIDDVPTALAARSYAADGTLAIAVDGGEPTSLAITDGRGRCAPAAHADLRLSRATLGTLYLGTASASLLARAGRIEGEPRAIALADRAFHSPIAPWCPELF